MTIEELLWLAEWLILALLGCREAMPGAVAGGTVWTPGPVADGVA